MRWLILSSNLFSFNMHTLSLFASRDKQHMHVEMLTDRHTNSDASYINNNLCISEKDLPFGSGHSPVLLIASVHYVGLLNLHLRFPRIMCVECIVNLQDLFWWNLSTVCSGIANGLLLGLDDPATLKLLFLATCWDLVFSWNMHKRNLDSICVFKSVYILFVQMWEPRVLDWREVCLH